MTKNDFARTAGLAVACCRGQDAEVAHDNHLAHRSPYLRVVGVTFRAGQPTPRLLPRPC